VPVVIYPVPVQGEGAAAKIAAALALASARAECDVLILARGGGSLEDLWSFNEEIVARAIRACAIPVVSGVGHEVDFTIADFAADRRAPTPSGAAEIVVPDAAEWLARLNKDAAGCAMPSRRKLRPEGRAARLAGTPPRRWPIPATACASSPSAWTSSSSGCGGHGRRLERRRTPGRDRGAHPATPSARWRRWSAATPS
jgi:exonuclease VII large subunit